RRRIPSPRFPGETFAQLVSASRTRNRYRVRLREPVRDPSASFASLTSLRMTLRGVRWLCKGLPGRGGNHNKIWRRPPPRPLSTGERGNRTWIAASPSSEGEKGDGIGPEMTGIPRAAASRGNDRMQASEASKNVVKLQLRLMPSFDGFRARRIKIRPTHRRDCALLVGRNLFRQ